MESKECRIHAKTGELLAIKCRGPDACNQQMGISVGFSISKAQISPVELAYIAAAHQFHAPLKLRTVQT